MSNILLFFACVFITILIVYYVVITIKMVKRLHNNEGCTSCNFFLDNFGLGSEERRNVNRVLTVFLLNGKQNGYFCVQLPPHISYEHIKAQMPMRHEVLTIKITEKMIEVLSFFHYRVIKLKSQGHEFYRIEREEMK